MKITGLLAFMICICCCCRSISQTNTFAADQFTFEYPKGWSVVENQTYLDVVNNNRSKDQAKELVTINQVQSNGMSLEKCFEIHVSKWYDDQHQGKSIETGSTIIDNRNAKWMQYQFGHEHSITSLTFLIYNNNEFYLIRGLCLTSDFSNFKSEFEKISKSFKIK